ncbi:MAG: alpha-ketoacid dehydrogenase subunit beta, partial [Deltaproteobacteria bacterium]|nr:alpha-ketoacid dehydrogenase subunit beta [Deltaproteobacteria bacterium]
MAKIMYREALRQAIMQEMERDPLVFCMGVGIGERGGSYKVTDQLYRKFGLNRIVDTPISEASFVGMAVGAAILGTRPIVEILFIDFACLAIDQLVNQA